MKEPIPLGKGDFGDIYDCFKGKADKAIEFLVKKKSGEATGALKHKDIGDIDLVWGKEGTARSNGYGLAKIAKFHPEVLGNLQGILGNMKITKKTENRVQLESDTYKATVRLSWNGKGKKWLLTAFRKNSGVSVSRTDIDGTVDSRKNDTPTLANTADSLSIPHSSDLSQGGFSC